MSLPPRPNSLSAALVPISVSDAAVPVLVVMVVVLLVWCFARLAMDERKRHDRVSQRGILAPEPWYFSPEPWYFGLQCRPISPGRDLDHADWLTAMSPRSALRLVFPGRVGRSFSANSNASGANSNAHSNAHSHGRGSRSGV